MSKWSVVLLVAGLAAACGPDTQRHAVADATERRPAAGATGAAGWRSSPAEGVDLRSDDGLVVATGPHAVVWPSAAPVLEPPYSVRAVVHKRSGRIHEGFGLVFGAAQLDRPEAEQEYSYFLIRGDGSFLIRRRNGTELPILQAWTSAPAIRRDVDGVAHPNELAVEVEPELTVFRVNGTEVARLATAELRAVGVAGLRVAHDVTLAVQKFIVDADTTGAMMEGDA